MRLLKDLSVHSRGNPKQSWWWQRPGWGVGRSSLETHHHFGLIFCKIAGSYSTKLILWMAGPQRARPTQKFVPSRAQLGDCVTTASWITAHEWGGQNCPRVPLAVPATPSQLGHHSPYLVVAMLSCISRVFNLQLDVLLVCWSWTEGL